MPILAETTPILVADEPAEDTVSENQLIEAARKCPQALAQLYRRHYAEISRYVVRRVGQVAVAEDLVGDVFLNMVRYLPRYRIGLTPFRAWLYRLATNRINRWARWQRRRAWQQLQDYPSREEPVSAGQDAALIRAALLSLPLPFQSVLALHYLEEMSIAAIAEILGCAAGTVKSRLSRGRQMLRSILTDPQGDL